MEPAVQRTAEAIGVEKLHWGILVGNHSGLIYQRQITSYSILFLLLRSGPGSLVYLPGHAGLLDS